MPGIEDGTANDPHTPEHYDDKTDVNIDERKVSQSGSEQYADVEKGDIKVQTTPDMDEAAKVLQEYAGGEPLVVTPEENKRLLRTIDWHLMPVLCIIYGLNYLDKTTLSYASIMGLKEDLHLVQDDYQWLSSAFYFGYLVFELPVSRLLAYFPLAKVSAFCIICWGVILACFAGSKNFGGALALRILLGVFEAAVTPGFVLITGRWYTQVEQASRACIWFSFNGWAQLLGGAIAYGVAVGTREHGSSMEPWKILFIVYGLLTICFGLYFLYIVPDSQLNARWLSKRDRALAVERIRSNHQGIGNKTFKWYQIREAITDPMTWAFALFALTSNIPNGGFSNFFSQLIVGFGYSKEESLLLGMPSGAVEVVALLVSGYLSTRYQTKKFFFSTTGGWVTVVGCILLVAVPDDKKIGRLIGYYLTTTLPVIFVCLLSMTSSNVAGYTKKTFNAALYLVAYCTGNIIGPQTFRPQDAPKYVPAEIVMLVSVVVNIFIAYFIWWWYARQNKIKEKIRSAPGYVKLENHE
ncbi:hypothetical protein KEM56_000002 [Ascosphaera pollenicola]|nr:hypothetical protein KEM56_000002 [Ascosphaera pollenicola]